MMKLNGVAVKVRILPHNGKYLRVQVQIEGPQMWKVEDAMDSMEYQIDEPWDINGIAIFRKRNAPLKVK